MAKKIIAVILILVAAGGWFYLDQQNKREQQEMEQARTAMEQARAQAKARAEAQAQFLARISTELATCQAAAEKARSDFIILKQKPVRGKPGQFTLPPAVADEAAKMLETANAQCQATYDTRRQSGS